MCPVTCGWAITYTAFAAQRKINRNKEYFQPFPPLYFSAPNRWETERSFEETGPFLWRSGTFGFQHHMQSAMCSSGPSCCWSFNLFSFKIWEVQGFEVGCFFFSGTSLPVGCPTGWLTCPAGTRRTVPVPRKGCGVSNGCKQGLVTSCLQATSRWVQK